MDPLTELGFLPGEYEIRTKGQQLMKLLSAVDPAQGILRGMEASGRAFDSSLPADVRKQAGIDAALETMAPAGILGIGTLAKQPAKAALLDMLTLTGAPSSMVREPGTLTKGRNAPRGAPEDPSRRKFMAGIASLPVAASVAPDILSGMAEKGVKGAVKVSTNALDSAAANMDMLKQMIYDLEIQRGDAMYEDDLLETNETLYDEILAEYDKDIDINELELRDQMNEMFDVIIEDPDLLKGAADETLETLAKEFYDNSKQIISGSRIQSMPADVRMPYDELAKEIRRRGLDAKKTESGMNQYSYSKTFAADILDPKEDPWSMISAADKTVPGTRFLRDEQYFMGGLV